MVELYKLTTVFIAEQEIYYFFDCALYYYSFV